MRSSAAILVVLAACSSPAAKTAPSRAPVQEASPLKARAAAASALVLRYQPPKQAWDYRLSFSVDSDASSLIKIATRGEIEFGLLSQGDQRLAFVLRKMALDMDAAGVRINVEGSAQRFAMTLNGVSKLDLEPGKAGPDGMVLGDLFGTPTHSFELEPQGPGVPRANPANGLVKLGLVDFAPMSMFFFPSVPADPVTLGASWTSSRIVPTSVHVSPKIIAEIHYRVVGVRACGSQARCAVIEMKANTGPRGTTNRGRASMVAYEFTGELLFDGSLVSADIHMKMSVDSSGVKMPMSGHYKLRRADIKQTDEPRR